VIVGLYNFYLYGSCNGLNDTGLCLLDITGANNQTSVCPNPKTTDPEHVTLAGVNLNLFPKIDRNSDKNVVFFGCVNCSYSRQVYELVKQVAAAKNANFIFAHYPIKTETTYLTGLLACAYGLNQDKYWQFLSYLFAHETAHNADQDAIITEAAGFGFVQEDLVSCFESSATATLAAQLQTEMDKTNLYGTPVVFIDETVLIGPKPKRVYERALSSFKLF
jgi:protein-disulfide isomerase